MRDEKEERKKQARSNKQGKATQHTQGSEKTASGGTRTHDTLYSRQSALPTELPRQLSWHVHVHRYKHSRLICTTIMHSGVVCTLLMYMYIHVEGVTYPPLVPRAATAEKGLHRRKCDNIGRSIHSTCNNTHQP